MENKKFKGTGIYDGCISKYVYNLIPEKTLCLDVGCWTGNLGNKLIKEKKCILDGIDFSVEALGVASDRGYRNTYCVNLNCAVEKLNDITEKYDYIICADVLEHLERPFVILENLKKNIKNEGFFVISIPNIAFVKQRVNLLLGKFDYDPAGGIMDETHLRFFTRKSLLSFFRKSGFEVASFGGYSQVRDRFFFLRYLAILFPSLFAIQFLIKVKKV